MITADFVNGAIDGLVSRFKRSQLHIRQHYYDVECEEGEPFEIHFYIEDEMDMMLTSLDVQFKIRLIDMYEATDIDVAVLVVSFIVDDELYIREFIVEGDAY